MMGLMYAYVGVCLVCARRVCRRFACLLSFICSVSVLCMCRAVAHHFSCPSHLPQEMGLDEATAPPGFIFDVVA